MTAPESRSAVDFVVVGAQRSATTHLNSCLRDHPEIFMCADEVPYFEDPFFGRSSPAELEAALAGAAPHQRRGIQRPDYLGHPECAANIAAAAPAAVILAVLREPVARALSAYFWYMQFGLLPLAPLDEGMERLLDGWADPAYPHAGDILEFGFYGRHLTRYVEIFGADQVLAVLNEDLQEPETFRSIYRSLGVATDHPPQVVNRGTNSGAYDLRRLRALRVRSKLAWSWDSVTEYTYRPRRLRRPVASLLSAGVVAVDRYALARVFKSDPPVLRADLEQRLHTVYSDDRLVLESLLGRDLTAWRVPDSLRE